ncbi:Txe/YoeB family addiction module toxin [Mucilaginibacter sp.]|uniref:Txe/YoeB family addiction module toxin n=1 Tax=Mucilaginibacter sp. TaxID=1882438 RepID=UPI0032675B93
MEVIFNPRAVEDLNYWKRSGNKGVQQKIGKLIDAIKENPFEGIGKPEPLKHNLSGVWSRK